MNKDFINSLTNNEVLTLKSIKSLNKNEFYFKDLEKHSDLKEVELMRAIEWLSNKKILVLDYEPYDEFYLDSNGIKYSKEGLPEIRILEFIKKNKNVFQEDLLKKFSKDEFSASIGILRRFQCLDMNKSDNGLELIYLKDLPHTMENDF